MLNLAQSSPKPTPRQGAVRTVGSPTWPVRPLLVILLAGALVRLALWGGALGQPLHIVDERDYNTLANNLLEHGEFAFVLGSPTSLRPPLYPAVVAGTYWLFGADNFQAVRLLQAILSLLN